MALSAIKAVAAAPSTIALQRLPYQERQAAPMHIKHESAAMHRADPDKEETRK